jgi:hypothetical protein
MEGLTIAEQGTAAEPHATCGFSVASFGIDLVGIILELKVNEKAKFLSVNTGPRGLEKKGFTGSKSRMLALTRPR